MGCAAALEQELDALALFGSNDFSLFHIAARQLGILGALELILFGHLEFIISSRGALEIFDASSKRVADSRQLAGTEDEKDDYKNYG
jgi:hypothetical protein